MEQEITQLLVFIGIALLLLSPFIIQYVIDAYKAKKERDSIEYATRILDDIYLSIHSANIDDEAKAICEEILIHKGNILEAKYNFLNR